MLSDVMTNAGPVAPSSFYDDECWSRGPKQNIKRKPFYLKMTMFLFFVGGGGFSSLENVLFSRSFVGKLVYLIAPEMVPRL